MIYRATILGAAGREAGAGGSQFGITSLPSLSTVSTSTKYGWEFTVGASDITVTGLRIYAGGAHSALLELFQADGTFLRGVTVTSADGEWVEGGITSVVLSANSNYVVTDQRDDGGSRVIRFNNDDSVFSFNSAISYVDGVFGAAGAETMPTSSTSGVKGVSDIVFTLGS